METRWYKDGTTREVELHIKHSLWENIKRNLHRFEVEAAGIEKQRNRRQYLKEASTEMCQNWQNCLKKSGKLLEDRKKLREIKKEQEDALHYESIKKNEEERRKFLEGKRKAIFIKKSFPNHLNMALRFAETHYENEQKIKLNKKIKESDKKLDAMFGSKIKEAAIEETIEKETFNKKQEEIKQKMAQVLLQEIQCKKEQKQLEKEARIKQEQEAASKAKEELNALNYYEKNYVSEKQKEMMRNYKEYVEMQKLYTRRMKKEAEETSSTNAIYQEALHRMNSVLKERHKQDRAVVNLRIEPQKKVTTEKQRQHLRKEEDLLNKQVNEKDKQEEAKLKSKLKLAKELKEDRLEERRKYCEKEQMEKKEEEEYRQYLLQNRIDAYEAFKEFNEKRRKQQWEDVKNYRKQLDFQVAEKNEAKKKQIEDDIIYRKQKEQELLFEDKQFFDYGIEVKNLAISKNRIVYPIDNAVNDYKKNFAVLSVLNERKSNST